MTAKKTGPTTERECPEGCPGEVWDCLSTGDQGTAPKTVAQLWEQWAEFREAASLLDTRFDGVCKKAGMTVHRLSLVIRDRNDLPCLAIVDGRKGAAEYALYHNGSHPFRTLMHACWRSSQDEADWRKREKRSGGGSESNGSPYTSGAF